MKLFAALLVPLSAWCAILPDGAGPWKRISVEPAAVADRPLWDEYGLREAETAVYTLGPYKARVAAWRLQDSTGAMAAFDWQRPADAKPSGAAPLAAETSRALLVAHGNCLVLFQDYKPGKEELATLLSAIPRVEMAALPTLPGFLPAQNLVPNSERYIVGPVSLERFQPGIPPSAAGFHLGSEARVAAFRSPPGEMKLALFSYPTPQLAMQQAEAIQKVPGALVKRSGPLVAVILAPPNADAAERLLSLVRYQAAVTLNERVPTRKDNIGNLILTAFELIGILLIFAVVSGFAFGGFKTLLRRGRGGEEAGAMILLDIDRESRRQRE